MNWSPRLGTAVSDLEVEYSEEPGHLYFFRCVCLRGGGERGEGRMLFCFGVRGFLGVFVRVRKGVTWSWSTTLRDSHAVCVCVTHTFTDTLWQTTQKSSCLWPPHGQRQSWVTPQWQYTQKMSGTR